MRRSLFSLLCLVLIWSFFYAWSKYFFWWVYADTLSPSLEHITAMVLIGSMIAYVIGWPLYAKFSEIIMLRFSLLFGIFSFWISAFLPKYIPFFLDTGLIGIWLSYSLYVIGKNTLIGREIHTSSLWSATVGAITTIIFIVFLIIGTVTGAKFGETLSFFLPSVVIFMMLLTLGFVALTFADTRSETTPFRISLDLYKRLFFRYGIFMIALSCFWQISVEASQVAINYSKDFFAKDNAEASLLLMFSSVWAIVGNIFSVKIATYRSQSFTLITTLFLITVFWFSSVLDIAKNIDKYFLVQILAGVLGVFFWWAVNLAESYFFSLLGSDPDKDYTSALYGFVMAMMGVIVMFISEKILHTGSYIGISVFLWFLAIFALYGGRKGIEMK